VKVDPTNNIVCHVKMSDISLYCCVRSEIDADVLCFSIIVCLETDHVEIKKL
jgi:hypothetical protein